LAESAKTVGDLMNILQDHGEGHAEPVYAWSNGGLNAPCVHAGGVLASSQSTASWVAELRPEGCSHWATGTSGPCTGLFKPVAVGSPIPLTRAEDTANDSLWWRHERLQRRVMENPGAYRPCFDAERRATQAAWIANPPSGADAFRAGDELLANWTAAVEAVDARDVRPAWTRRYWAKRNARAGLAEARREAVPLSTN
jgi:hypothetical protein